MLTNDRTSLRRASALLALALTAACEPASLPTDASVVADPVYASAAAGKGRVRISSVNLSSTSLTLNASTGVVYTVTLQNDSKQSLSDVGIRAEIVQGTSVAPAGGTMVSCPTTPGLLPPGTCTIQFTVTATTLLAPLVAGAATFVVHLEQLGARRELDQQSVGVTLVEVGQPYIASIQMNPTTLIFGNTHDYTLVIENPTGNTITNTLVQAEFIQVRQGRTYYGGGGGIGAYCLPLAEIDQLLPGTCTMPTSTTPQASPTGLQDGPATFEVKLYINGALVSTRSIAVTLVFPIG